MLVEGVNVPIDGVDYHFTINAPTASTETATADWAGGNHSPNKARSLGSIRDDAVLTGLRVAAGADDWFSFEVPRSNSDQPCAVGAVTVHLATDATAMLRVYDGSQDAAAAVPLVEQSGRRVLRAFYATTAGKVYRFSVQSLDDVLQNYSIAFDPAVGGACGQLAYSNFDEPTLGSANYFSTPASRELGFFTVSEAVGAQPLVGVFETSTTPTSPVLAHRSVRATTLFDSVDLTNVVAASVSIAVQVRNTGYEAGDYLRVYVINGSQYIELLSAQGSNALDLLDELADDGYVTYTAAIPDSWTSATLVLESATNSSAGAERFDFDNVQFQGIATPRLAGDLNLDRRVGLVDLALLQRNYGRSAPAAAVTADLNGDGQVNHGDLFVVVANFGRALSPSPANSPSPSASPAPPLALLASFDKPEAGRKTAEREESIDDRHAAPLRAIRHSRPAPQAVDAALSESSDTPEDTLRGRRARRRAVFA